MEVVSANNGLLTNLEVLDILKEHKDKRNDKQPAVEKQVRQLLNVDKQFDFVSGGVS